ncbi:Uma2 family endonuclease [Aureimonas flava]|uniref:Uma2 family endonuclease n=1 Tax=Aureimonas flava TaxID=2320271 RepID=A0A3A1WMH5_9HYPH|nr:Uma2 family endonuclease [Aureimonas flava]RIY02061.1 Uma2 family endonuclease [Aureimonas flava]
MSEAKARTWSLSDFLLWEEGQECRHELVEGHPILMAGGTQAHALIAANIVSTLRSLLRGSPCRPVGSDLRIPIVKTGNVRYPDATIDCGPFRPDAHDASEPNVVFEVLSQSTGWYDQTRKLRDYESVASIRQYVCVSQSETRVSLWLRDDVGRLVPQDDILHGSVAIDLATTSFALPLAEIYEGTALMPPPAATA